MDPFTSIQSRFEKSKEHLGKVNAEHSKLIEDLVAESAGQGPFVLYRIRCVPRKESGVPHLVGYFTTHEAAQNLLPPERYSISCGIRWDYSVERVEEPKITRIILEDFGKVPYNFPYNRVG